MSFRMLLNGRVDVVVSEREAGRRFINNEAKYNDVIELGYIQKLDIYSYLHTKHSDLGKDIAITLELMKQDGTYNQIKEKSLSDYHRKHD